MSTTYRARAYNPRWLTGFLAVVAVGMVGGAAASVAYGGEWVLAGVLLGGAAVDGWLAYALRWFEVEVDGNELRYGWRGFPAGRIPLREIASAEVAKYPWIYGWGWRAAGRTLCYSIPFDREALLVTRSGGGFFRRYYFTVPGAAAAVEAIVRARAGGS